MKLSKIGSLIKVEFPYDTNTVQTIKSIYNSVFVKNPSGSYWTIFPENLPNLFSKFDLSPGYLYPDCMEYLNKNSFKDLVAEIKHDRIKLQGKSAFRMYQSINDLCSIEYKDKTIIREALGELIYNKNDTIVYAFPLGLYWRVSDFVSKCGVELIVHPYPRSPEQQPIPLDIIPRHYQTLTTEKILTEEIPNRATLCMATGGGKTILSAMITAALGVNTIFYTYSTDLLEQTADVFKDIFQQPIGRVGGSCFDLQPITIATVQTVISCYEMQDDRWDQLEAYLCSVELMFIDEGHMLGAETLYKVAQLTDSYYAYALTATPEREDGKELMIEAGTGPVVEIITEEQLVEEGYILPVNVEIVEFKHTKYTGVRYSTLYRKNIIENTNRNLLIAEAVKKYAGKQTIILVKEIKHGEVLANLLHVPFIHGTSKNRTSLLDAFKQGHINTLIASSILKQGIDIPDAEVLILAHGGASKVELIQKIGRVRRPAPNKTRSIVVDFYDHCSSLTDDIFLQQSNKRLKIYQEKSYLINSLILDKSLQNIEAPEIVAL